MVLNVDRLYFLNFSISSILNIKFILYTFYYIYSGLWCIKRIHAKRTFETNSEKNVNKKCIKISRISIENIRI